MLALGLTAPLLGCEESPPQVAPPGTAESSSSGTTSSVADVPPGRVPSPPFELPEGCGDGVIVPGQYDCFFPVPIDWLEDALGGYVVLHPLDLDLDGDGRDEMLVHRSGRRTAVLRWDDEELQLGPLLDSPGSTGSARIQTRWDWNGDGRRDVTVLPVDVLVQVGMHPSLGADGIGEHVLIYDPPAIDHSQGSYGSSGHILVDVDGDGIPEVLASMKVDAVESANPAEDLVLFRRTGTTWAPVGEAYRWGPCGVLLAAAHGDFDGDGDEDVALVDHGQACDPYPSSYDPEWYRVWVLLSDSEAGVLELGGWYPAGGVVKEPILWAEDVTGDGHLDLVVEIDEPLEYGVAVLRGRGDGSFDDGNPVDLGPILPIYNAQALIDVDGNGTREWIVSIVEGRPWVIPFDFSADGIAPMVALNDPEAGGSTRFKEAVGDINGDGVGDYRVRAAHGRYQGDFLMVSAP